MPVTSAPGLHAITLQADLLGRSRVDLGDIRLVDSAGVQVPYVIEEVRSSAAHGHFVPYRLLRNEAMDRSTVIEFEREGEKQVDALHIWIRPTDAAKKVRVTGSDDRQHWYMVKDEHLAAQGARGDPPHQVLIMDLPRSDYRYFRLTLNDSLTAPLNVLGVGYFDEGASALPHYLDAGALPFLQRDSAGESYLHIRCPRPLLIERLEYRVSDTVRYRRDATMLHTVHDTLRRGRHDVPLRSHRLLGRSTLASDLAPVIEFPASRLDTFELLVHNGDDRPLHFVALHAQVVHRVLLAELQPGMRYRLTTGDATGTLPRYDMAHFADELPTPVDTLIHGALTALPIATTAAPLVDPSQWWVWAAIISLMVGMGWMAMRMLKGQHPSL